MAKGRMRPEIPELKDALARRFNSHHALLCKAMLARIDQADVTIDELTARIEVLLDPHEAAVSLLVGIPGVSYRSAQVILAEIGTDMSRFPTAGHLASWAGMSQATTSLPASTARGGPVTAPNGSASPSSKPLMPLDAPKTPTLARSTPVYGDGGERGVPRWPLDTQSWSSSGICSPPARPTTTWAATTSTSAAPVPPTRIDSSPSSKPWDTKSPSNPQPEPPHNLSFGAPPPAGATAPTPRAAHVLWLQEILTSVGSHLLRSQMAVRR